MSYFPVLSPFIAGPCSPCFASGYSPFFPAPYAPYAPCAPFVAPCAPFAGPPVTPLLVAQFGQLPSLPTPSPISVPFPRGSARGRVSDIPTTITQRTRCTSSCTLHTLPNETSAPAAIASALTPLLVVGVQPGWVEVVASFPAQGPNLAQNIRGWLRYNDLQNPPAGSEPGAAGGGGGTTTPVNPGGGAGTGTGTGTPAGQGTDPELTQTAEPGSFGAKSTAAKIGEVVLLTAPAWGSFLLTRFFR